MNWEFFIAKRINSSKSGSYSKIIIRVAIAAVALSVAVMITSNAIADGFQKSVANKVFGFWGHIQILKFDNNVSDEQMPFSKDQPFLEKLRNNPEISHVQSFATKAGIIKTATDILGVRLKGISADFDWSFLEAKLEEGNIFGLNDSSASKGILISRSIANKLNLKVGDKLVVHFISGNRGDGKAGKQQFRSFKVSGIYNTGLEEYDKEFVFIDIRQVQKLNRWESDQIGGFEVFVKDHSFLEDIKERGSEVFQGSRLNAISREINLSVPDDLIALTLKEIHPSIFDWLSLQEITKYIILIMMILVASINMITVLLIIIVERTNMIGILKAMGAGNNAIQKVFVYNSLLIIGSGLLIGNFIGIGLCLIQARFNIIKLPPESYYVSVVPVDLNLFNILLISLGTIILCNLALLIPSRIIARISPIQAIRFD